MKVESQRDLGGIDVRSWHLADVQTALMNVRFEGNNRHDGYVTRCLLMTHSGRIIIPSCLSCLRCVVGHATNLVRTGRCVRGVGFGGWLQRHLYARRHYRRGYRRGYYGYGYGYRPYYGYGYGYRPYGYYGYGWRPGITIGIGRGWGWRY